MDNGIKSRRTNVRLVLFGEPTTKHLAFYVIIHNFDKQPMSGCVRFIKAVWNVTHQICKVSPPKIESQTDIFVKAMKSFPWEGSLHSLLSGARKAQPIATAPTPWSIIHQLMAAPSSTWTHYLRWCKCITWVTDCSPGLFKLCLLIHTLHKEQHYPTIVTVTTE